MSQDTTNNSFAAVYPQIADRLEQQLPGTWVDLDQGQLENEAGATEYALDYDTGVLLVDFEEVDWQDLLQGVQQGEAIIKITVARRVVADTYSHSSQRAAAMAQLEVLGQVHRALQRFAGQGFGSMVRTYSRKEQSPLPGVWVYSMGYRCRLFDDEGYTQPAEASDIEPAPERAFQISLGSGL